MELSKSASAIGLYSYGRHNPGSDGFSRFYSLINEQFHSWGVAATYIGAEGEKMPRKMTKINGRVHKKLIESHFSDISTLILHVNPLGSDAPGYDNFISVSLGYISQTKELLACCKINEAYVSMGSSRFDVLIRSLIDLSEWDFGFGFPALVKSSPDLYIMGMGNGEESPEEYQKLCIWYLLPGNVRVKILRDIYQYNILNEAQLNSQLRPGVSLRQYAQKQPGCSLTKSTGYGLYLWRIPASEINRVKNDLVGTSLMLESSPLVEEQRKKLGK